MATQTSNKKTATPPPKGQKQKVSSSKKYIVYGLGAGALLGGGYLLYNYLRDRQVMQRGQGLTVNNIIPTLPSPSPPRITSV